MIVVLFAILTAPPCNGTLATIGSVAVPCQRLVGVDPGKSLCGATLRILRAQATEMAMQEAGVHPGEEGIGRRLDLLVPKRAEAQAEINSRRERQRRIAAAMKEWRADPASDREIFARHLEGVMAYEHWVSFRSMVGSAPVADPQGDAALSDEGYLELRARYRPAAVEQAFQEWVRGGWRAKTAAREDRPARQAAAWTPALQNAFWTEFLETHPIRINGELKCPVVSAEVLQAPGSEPGSPRTSPTPIPLPAFATARDALKWADAEAAKLAASGSTDPAKRMNVLAAYQRVAELPGATAALRVDAGLKRAEALLGISALREAMATLEALEKSDVDESGRYPEVFERLAETFELLNDKVNPLPTYRRALQLQPKPGWKALLHYRAGLAAKLTGHEADAVAHLEEAVKLLPAGTTQGIMARSVLARSLATIDPARAARLSKEALAGLAGSPKPAKLPRSFVAEPPPEDLAHFVKETDAKLKR